MRAIYLHPTVKPRICFLIGPFSKTQKWISSTKKLSFMILSPPEHTAEKWIFLQKNAFSLKKNAFSQRTMHFPAQASLFLQKMRFSRGTWQETAGNSRRVSGLKNQERQPAFTRGFTETLCSLWFSVQEMIFSNFKTVTVMVFWGNKCSIMTRLPVVILTRTVIHFLN